MPGRPGPGPGPGPTQTIIQAPDLFYKHQTIEDAYGGSSPHPLQTVRITSKFCPKFIKILTFFDDFGGLGASGADLAEKDRKCPKSYAGAFSIWGVIFGHYRQKVGIRKSTVFQILHFRPKISPGAPKVGIMADLGPEKLRKWSPK